jgi:hypothetical protein
VKAAADAAIESDFDEWYRTYPRHEAKAPGLKAYKTARKTATCQQLLDAITRQKPRLIAVTDPKFIPLPATWLNGQRWLDEAPAPANEPRPNAWMQAERKIPESWRTPEAVEA